MMRSPRTGGGPDDDGVLIGRHDVLDIRRHEQKAAQGIALYWGVIANGQFQDTLDDRDPRIRAVGVPVMIAGGNKGGISEGLPVCVGVALKNGPLRSVLVNALPLNCFRAPGLRNFVFLACAGYTGTSKYDRQHN